MDLWKMDVRRFGPQYARRGYCLARTDEVYSTYYDIVFPNHERAAGRPLRVPAAYERHVALGAEFAYYLVYPPDLENAPKIETFRTWLLATARAAG